MPDYSLAVSRKELIDAVRRIVKFRKSAGGFVRLSYADGALAIATINVTIGVSAEGTWPTEVKTPSSWLRSLARVSPTADPVPVTFDGARVLIGTTAVAGQAVPPVTPQPGPPGSPEARGTEVRRRGDALKASQRRRLAAQAPDVVRAKRFELVDAKGNERAILTVGHDNSVVVVLAHDDGTRRLRLALSPSGEPALEMYDAEGKPVWRAP